MRRSQGVRTSYFSVLAFAVVVGVVGSICVPAHAHETDQFTVPPGREFADIGPLISQWAYDSIKRGVDSVNADIKDAVERGNRDELRRLHSDRAVVPAVNKAFPWA